MPHWTHSLYNLKTTLSRLQQIIHIKAATWAKINLSSFLCLLNSYQARAYIHIYTHMLKDVDRVKFKPVAIRTTLQIFLAC